MQHGDYPIRDVTAWLTQDDEPMGTKEKVWLKAPGDGGSHLFKRVRIDRIGSTYGDDWAEKLASELAGLLRVPAAEVDLARRGEAPGVVCRRINDRKIVDLAHGNELLAARQPAYDMDRKREHPHYTVEAVRDCLGDVASPPDVSEPLTGFDTWAGYLAFDAWIANTDRHHENWGVLIDTRDGSKRLSPSFDHGSSLGFNVSARAFQDMLDHPEALQRWCRYGRSNHFAGRPRLVQLAAQALATAGPRARAHWLGTLHAIRPDDWNRIIDRIPDTRMSEPARTVVSTVLEVNRGRLLDACGRSA